MKKLIVAAMMVTQALYHRRQRCPQGKCLRLRLMLRLRLWLSRIWSSWLTMLRGKAYNKLVDLGMKAFNDQQSIQQTNQIMKKNDPVDENAMNEGAYNALMNAIECYKYDQLPNAKGKAFLSSMAMHHVFGVLASSS